MNKPYIVKNGNWYCTEDWVLIANTNNKKEQHQHLENLGYKYLPNWQTGGDDDIFIIDIKSKLFTYCENGEYSITDLSFYNDIHHFLSY